MPWENNRPTHVPTRVREACLKRDGNRCTATQRNGERCPETTRLEAAHINPWREGETVTVNMVRTLCHWHHNRETQAQAAEARQRTKKFTPPRTHPREKHPGLR